jgi:hypothetical protein
MAEWFSKLAKDAMTLADGITDTITEQAKSAQADILKEQERMKAEVDAQRKVMTPSSLLPWETGDETRAILSQDLMEQILSLPLNDKNFTVPPPEVDTLPFSFEAFVPTIMRLLQLDTNLARVHAKLSPKMNEELFWRYYHYRVEFLRAKVGILDDHDISVDALLRGDVIYKPDIETDAEIPLESSRLLTPESVTPQNKSDFNSSGLSLLGLSAFTTRSSSTTPATTQPPHTHTHTHCAAFESKGEPMVMVDDKAVELP